MKTTDNIRNHARGFKSREDGWVTPWSLFLVVTFLMIGGLAVDYANGMMTKAKLQAVSDAAALAASIDLPDETKATAAGLEYAAKHYTSEDGSLIVAEDFAYGNYDSGSDTFTIGATPVNAVQVIANRTGSRSNALRTWLLRLVGFNTLNVVTSAVAATEVTAGSACENGGFFSNSEIISGSNNDYIDNFCLYGYDGVKIGSDNSFEEGTYIEMRRTRDFQKGSSNSIPSGTVRAATHDLKLIPMIPDICASMKSRSLDYMPSYIYRTKKVDKLEPEKASDLKDGMLYYVKDVADLSKVKTVKNIAIMAQKEVKIGSDHTMYNVVFCSPDKILVGSNNTFEHPDACDNGKYSVYLFSRSNIEFGSNNEFTGVQMASEQEIKLGSDVKGLMDVYGEADGNFDYGSADTFGGCPGGMTTEIGDGPTKSDPSGGGPQTWALVR